MLLPLIIVYRWQNKTFLPTAWSWSSIHLLQAWIIFVLSSEFILIRLCNKVIRISLKKRPISLLLNKIHLIDFNFLKWINA